MAKGYRRSVFFITLLVFPVLLCTGYGVFKAFCCLAAEDKTQEIVVQDAVMRLQNKSPILANKWLGS